MKANITLKAVLDNNKDVKITIDFPYIETVPEKKYIPLMCQKLIEIAELKTGEKMTNCRVKYNISEDFESAYYAGSVAAKYVNNEKPKDGLNLFVDYHTIPAISPKPKEELISRKLEEIASLQFNNKKFKEVSYNDLKDFSLENQKEKDKIRLSEIGHILEELIEKLEDLEYRSKIRKEEKIHARHQQARIILSPLVYHCKQETKHYLTTSQVIDKIDFLIDYLNKELIEDNRKYRELFNEIKEITLRN